MKKLLSYILFITVLYFWIFSPDFWIFRGRFVISYIIGFVSILTCMIKPQIFINFHRKYQKEFIWLLYFLAISIFLLTQDFQTSIIANHLIVLVNLFCVIPVLLTYAHRYGFDSESDIVKSLLIVCSIAGVISILCLSFPSLNDYVKHTLIKYDMDSYLYDNDYRGFGFASLLTGNYGFVLGFLLALGCSYIKENRWFIFSIPIIIIAIMINARTGILIAVIGIACIFLQSRNALGYGIIFSILAIVSLFYLDSFLLLLGADESTIEWITEFNESVENVIQDKDVKSSATTSVLFGDMIVLPEDLFQWIIGRGYYIFSNEHGNRTSDMGWLNQLNYGGLIYFIPLLAFFYKIARHFTKKKGFGFGLFILATIMISNTKGRLFPLYSLFTIIMFIYFIISQEQTRPDDKID